MASVSLLQRIESQRGNRAASEIKELDLSDSRSATVDGLSDEYTSLEVLRLENVGLENLSGFPTLPALKVLDLSKNAVTGGLDSLCCCPNLEDLDLSSNKIDSIDNLAPLAKLSHLRSLNLANCAVTGLDNYRKAIFAALPNLGFLDGLDENDQKNLSECIPNGDVDEANGDEENESDDEDDEEEEYGIEALQFSGELEDDDEDYAPGEEEDADLGEFDEDDEEEEDDEVVDDGANLSGAGVTGPRRPGSKRRHSNEVTGTGLDDEAPVAKQKITADTEAHVKNGAAVE